MLASMLEHRGVPLGRVIGEAIEYFRGCQQPDGSIADDPTSALFREWDSVNVLKAIALWQEENPTNLSDLIEPTLGFLAAQEKPNGMLSYGGAEIASNKYCAEDTDDVPVARSMASPRSLCVGLETIDRWCIASSL